MPDRHDTDIQQLEQQLADLSPSPLSENLLSRMEKAMISWENHLPVEEKIVPFEAVSETTLVRKSSFSVWSAAAAIALMGAVGAIFMQPSGESNTDQLGAYASNDDTDQKADTSDTQPHFSHQITNASNEGITYAGNNKPYKVIRIEYTKDVERIMPNGKTFTHKEPAVDHILVPIELQ